MGSEHYCLRWNNHQSNLLGVFSQLLQDESLVDVTLACSEGASIRAHKFAASSEAVTNQREAVPTALQMFGYAKHLQRSEVVTEYLNMADDWRKVESKLGSKNIMEELVDVEIVVLSACSSYFQSLFLEHPSRHPIVILKDVRFSELRTLVEFMYKGEVNVEYCQLSALLKTAESLKVKGLAEMTNLNATTQENDRDQENMSSRSQQHDMMSRHDTPTRHDRKHNNTATSTATSESQESVNKRLAPPEESDTPPPRLAMSPNTINPLNPLALPLHCRGMRGRPEPMDPGPDEGPGGGDGHRASSPEDDTVPHRSNCGPSEMGLNMSINANINNASTASSGAATSTATTAGDLRLIQMSSSATSTVIVPSTSRLNSPMAEPIAGPSGLPPVQQVPLSLKKEVDWDRGDDKSSGGSPLEYRHSHDPEMCVDASILGPHGEGSPRLYPCMYCGAAFPHQSKLTRHILSHSLETLKYREQMHLQHPGLGLGVGLGEPLSLMESHFSGRPPPSLKCEAMGLSGLGSLGDLHEPPDVPMELDFSSGIPDQGNVVLCKFCGKSFPDVSSLIAHLPVHTGDRPFKCEFCGKAFKLRHHMKDHCRVHTGERPFRCGLCGKTFSRSTILKAHEKTHYPKYVRKFLSPSPVDTEEESPHQ